MSTNTQNQEIEFDLNELPELPDFISWPAGSYKVEGVSLGTETITFGSKGDVVCVSLKVKLLEVNETKPVDATVPPVNSEQTWNFPLVGDDEEKTTMAQGRIRKLLTPLAQAFGTTKNLEIYQKFPGYRFTLITSVRVVKGDKLAGEEDKVYSGIKSIITE